MHRTARIVRAQAIAIPRPPDAATHEWIAAGVALALLLAGLVAP